MPRPIRRLLAVSLLLGALPLAAPSTARAQTLGFSDIDNPGITTQIPPKEHFDERFKDSALRLGILRFLPSLAIDEIRLVTNSSSNRNDFSTEIGTPDLTAIFEAGTRAYFRTGPQVVWAINVLPQYTWWLDNSIRRRFNTNLRLGAFGYFARLRFEASHSDQETQRFFSEERPELTVNRQTLDRAAVTVRVHTRTHLTLGLTERQVRGGLDRRDEEFSSFDRTEDIATLGIFRTTPRGFRFGLTHSEVRSRFARRARSLSNDLRLNSLILGYSHGRLATRLTLTDRNIRRLATSRLVSSDDSLGELRVSWDFGRYDLRVDLNRESRFSLDDRFSEVLADRLEIQLRMVARDFSLRVVGRFGENRFTPLAGVDLRRTDKVTGYTLQVVFPDMRWVAPTISISQLRFDSNLDGRDRRVSSVGFNLIYKFNIPRIPTQIPLPIKHLGTDEIDPDW